MLCILAGYKRMYLARQMDVSAVRTALTARIVGHDEKEKEVSLTFAWIVAFERKIGQFDRR